MAGYGYTSNQRHELTAIDFLPSVYNAEDVSYTYDPRGQLTGANYSSQTDDTYTYDDNGNRNNGSFMPGVNNWLLSDSTFTYTYDNEGNRLTRTRISSAQADDKVVEYTWDHRNRLIKVTFKNNAGAVTKTVSACSAITTSTAPSMPPTTSSGARTTTRPKARTPGALTSAKPSAARVPVQMPRSLSRHP